MTKQTDSTLLSLTRRGAIALGAGMAAGISNLYYPGKERTFGSTAGRWATNVGLDAGTFLFKEFWPDINHSVFHYKE